MVEVELENYDDAKTLLSKALSLSPNDPYFLNNRGYIFLLTNEMDQAKEDIDLSITLDPYNGWAYRNKGIYYLRSGQLDDALRLLKRAESSDGFIEKVNFFLGEVYDRQNNKQLACGYYAKALDRNEMSAKDYQLKCK
jgi:tetratricopeptide (TPR) repeat protein